MGLRDILRKKDDVQAGTNIPTSPTNVPDGFVFVRSDTVSQEIIEPPDYSHLTPAEKHSSLRRSLDVFRGGGRSRSASASSQTGTPQHRERRLSQKLGFSRQPENSEHVPAGLPELQPVGQGGEGGQEASWEQRATILAGQNEIARSRPTTPHSRPTSSHGNPRMSEGSTSQPSGQRLAQMRLESVHPGSGAGAADEGKISSQEIDADIQEAIRLHESGDLLRSTKMFGKLADPYGANNPLSQVLYGLALRHGWGCEPDPENAVQYLSAAASNAAAVEQLALKAGMRKGGAAKGELVLAIFELANCFRHGWGIPKDALAAKQYYETAANLGDTDAMNEIAWCYLEGYGCKKDKFVSARYYRLAEKAGNKTLGNSWIWKDKYNTPEEN